MTHNPYRDGDYVAINRDDINVADWQYDKYDERYSPFYGTVQKAIGEDKVQVLCDSGELRTFNRYQLDHCDGDGEVVEDTPINWQENLAWLAAFAAIAFVVWSLVISHV